MALAGHSAQHAMLFNSPEFILGFLPIALGGFFLLGRLAGPVWALRWLVAASLFFYAALARDADILSRNSVYYQL